MGSTRGTSGAGSPPGTRRAARGRCAPPSATHEDQRDASRRGEPAGGVSVRILSRRQVHELLSLGECIVAVERAFRLHAEGRTFGPGVLGVPAVGGGFHIKAAGLASSRN